MSSCVTSSGWNWITYWSSVRVSLNEEESRSSLGLAAPPGVVGAELPRLVTGVSMRVVGGCLVGGDSVLFLLAPEPMLRVRRVEERVFLALETCFCASGELQSRRTLRPTTTFQRDRDFSISVRS
jgi:hypothetical protein